MQRWDFDERLHKGAPSKVVGSTQTETARVLQNEVGRQVTVALFCRSLSSDGVALRLDCRSAMTRDQLGRST